MIKITQNRPRYLWWNRKWRHFPLSEGPQNFWNVCYKILFKVRRF